MSPLDDLPFVDSHSGDRHARAARAHAANLPHLQAKWDAEGEAYDRFRIHGNRRLYEIELRAIDERYGS